MNSRTKKLLEQPPGTLDQQITATMRIVRAVMESPIVLPKFQHTKKFKAFQSEVPFNTAEAYSGFLRAARKGMSNRERAAERIQIQRLMQSILAVATEEELTRKCLDVSVITALMLEELGIWAICYMGNYTCIDPETRIAHSFYFLDDELNPESNSKAKGHAWITTPSYTVIDLTAKFQPLDDEAMQAKVPSPVLIEESTVMPFREEWYIRSAEPEEAKKVKRNWLRERGILGWNTIHTNQHLLDCLRMFYVPITLCFSDKPLGQFETDVTFGGLKPLDFLEQFKRSL